MFEIYQKHYNPRKTKTLIKAIKLHNPGADIWYKKKVLKHYKIITELNEKNLKSSFLVQKTEKNKSNKLKWKLKKG